VREFFHLASGSALIPIYIKKHFNFKLSEKRQEVNKPATQSANHKAQRLIEAWDEHKKQESCEIDARSDSLRQIEA
jgi:hypothetical protein